MVWLHIMGRLHNGDNVMTESKPICLYCKKRISYFEYRTEQCQISPTKLHETTVVKGKD